MIEKIILLVVILLLGLLSKNETITIAVIILIGLVLLNVNDKTFSIMKNYSIKYGIVLITIYAFIPIAKGDITFTDIIASITSWRAWIAILAGVLVTHFAKYGIEIMNNSPDITTFVIIGIIIGIIVFKGVASGPLIGSGIALTLYSLIDFVISFFK